MIGKICPRGKRPHGLLRYLYATGPAQQEGRGGRNRHVDPRLVGGWDDPAELEPPVDGHGRRDFRRLAALLEQPLAAAGVEPEKRPVYHLVIAARKDPDTGELVDRLLTDEQWRDIAEEYLHRLGLAPRGDDLGVRWVAVRHADDHLHVVVTLARQDGRRVFLRNDFYRSGEASRYIEAKYGLSVTAGSDRTAAKRPTRAEARKAQRLGQGEPVRDRLRRSVRSAAAGAGSLPEFLERLRDDGLLVRERLSEHNPGEVTGYAVALPELTDPAGKPVYFGGGKLAADLTLPQLRRRWQPAGTSSGGASTGTGTGDAGGSEQPAASADGPGRATGTGKGTDRHRLTQEERDRIWVQATAAAARATEQISSVGASDPGAAGDAAWAGSDFLAAAARVVEGRRGGPLTTAAESYDRAPRELWGRTPTPTAAGGGLRAAGVLLASARFVGRDETRRLLALLAQLAALSDAVTRLRETQDRAAQAAAARRTAEQLRATVTDRTAALAAAGARGQRATAPPAAQRPDRSSRHPARRAAVHTGEQQPAVRTRNLQLRQRCRRPGESSSYQSGCSSSRARRSSAGALSGTELEVAPRHELPQAVRVGVVARYPEPVRAKHRGFEADPHRPGWRAAVAIDAAGTSVRIDLVGRHLERAGGSAPGSPLAVMRVRRRGARQGVPPCAPRRIGFASSALSGLNRTSDRCVWVVE